MKHNFRNIQVWQKSVDLAVEVMKATKDFPVEYRFGLSSQINRSSISIPSNIAEGSSRNTVKDFSRFLDIATGSCYELETQLIIAQKVEALEPGTFEDLNNNLIEIQKMISGFKKSLN